MTSITLFDTVILDDAVSGPLGLKVWPASALEPILRAFRKRVLMDGFKQNFNGDITIHHKKGSHHGGRPRGLKQFQEDISQQKNRGRR